MPHPSSFKSDFLLLDVKRGRERLAKRIAAGEKVTVWIKATLDHGVAGIGNDDGVSQEFGATVHSIKVSNGVAA